MAKPLTAKSCRHDNLLPFTINSMAMVMGLALAAGALLSGCGTGSSSRAISSGGQNYGNPTSKGLKPPSQVPPACRDFAAGKISLAECMARPDCKQCALQSIEDLQPAGMR